MQVEILSPYGRINRMRFIILLVCYIFLIYLPLCLLLFTIFESIWVLIIPILIMLYLVLILKIKRFHDMGYSWWYALLSIIPWIWFIIFCILMIYEGVNWNNDYWEDIKEKNVNITAFEFSILNEIKYPRWTTLFYYWIFWFILIYLVWWSIYFHGIHSTVRELNEKNVNSIETDAYFDIENE